VSNPKNQSRTAYNFNVVLNFIPIRRKGLPIHRKGLPLRIGAVALLLFSILVSATCLRAQLTPQPVSTLTNHGRILLVLPFDNRSGLPSLEWIREAAADVLSTRFASAGFAPMTRADRMYALDHLGLPQGFQPSRASSLKLAQTLDADYIVVGNYRMDGTSIVAEAQLVDVAHLRMTPTVGSYGGMSNMIAVFGSLAFKLTRQLDPSLPVDEQTFVAAGANMRLDAYEQYIRGITEADQAERLRHLKQSVLLSPGFSPAWMALGREQYQAQQYQDAAQAFAKVDPSSQDALEAGFDRGLSLMFSGNYAGAQKAFDDIAKVLPLAEVVNNQAVSISRQGHDGTALFVQAASSDPNNADYHFNLAVSLKRQGKTTSALNELAQCLKLRPTDTEAQSLEQAWKNSAAANGDSAAAPQPLERIVRTFDASAFRQAAAMIDQVDATHLAALTTHEQAVKICEQAGGYLHRGLLLEAERLYQSAASTDSNLADAHVGLAEVSERVGDNGAARKQAQQALELAPSADAYLVLGRLDFEENHLAEARSEAGNALKLSPGSSAAEELMREVGMRDGSTK